MNKQAIVWIVVIIVFALVAVPIGRNHFLVKSLEVDVSNILVEYGGTTPDLFEKRLLGICRDNQVDMDTVEIEFGEPTKGRLEVDIWYTRNYRVMLVPVSKDIHLHLERNVGEF